MEGLALTGAWVDREQGLLSTIVLEMGGSSDLCALLKPGEPVVLMGPTGTPTETPAGETVLLVGGGLGNAVLFSIGAALRAAGSRVLYFAGYKKIERPLQGRARSSAPPTSSSGAATRRRASRRPAAGQAPSSATSSRRSRPMARARSATSRIPLREVDRIIAIGSDGMMNAVGAARRAALQAAISSPDHRAIASINSPMQCMMKEICAQCLQRQ